MSGFERGILYIATGPSFLTEAVGSAQSVRAAWPDISLALIADAAPPPGWFDHVEIVEAERNSRDKPRFMSRSPFRDTIFLDADTYCCAPCPELFDQLERFELLAAHDDGRFSTKVDAVTGKERFVRVPGIPESFPELNTGVMAFRRSLAIAELFERWIAGYDEVLNGPLSDYHDQPSFRAAVYRSAVRFGVIPSEYNFRLGCPGKARTQIKIIHGRWSYEPIAPTRAATMQALDRAFNINHGHRAFVPALGMIYGHGPLAHSPADPERVVTLGAIPEPASETLAAAPERIPKPVPETLAAAPLPMRQAPPAREPASRALVALRRAAGALLGFAIPAKASRQAVP